MTWPYLKQYLKFLFVLSCAVSAWVRFFRRRGSLKGVSPFLPAALSFAVAADYCFLFSGNYTAAVAFSAVSSPVTAWCAVLPCPGSGLWGPQAHLRSFLVFPF